MDLLLSSLDPVVFLLAVLVALLAGLIKGMVGFGMPMVLISGLSSLMAPELALAGLILPTLLSNGVQAFRQGVGAAIASVKKFRVFLWTGLVFLLISAQFVPVLPQNILLLVIGVPVAIFAGLQLLGVQMRLTVANARAEMAVGGFAGVIGGLSGVWGPPTVLYLTALNTEKTEQIRVQGVIYGLGAVALLAAHLTSGVLRWETLPLSIGLLPPAMFGMWIGTRIHDRIDQETFRKATLIILTIAALNLIRRAVFI
ncbi:sulfite exporter TauE/SafE family protein [Pelagimonas sp. KU-00592-HH]|uniref:sulfite exporter TauE/SafE family protein n=1 Tax=Pelagimonas sp. KU-00592-HH TaxID=3127651 RepID=UPI00333F4F27